MNEQEIRKEALAMAIKTIRDEKEISSLLERARIFSQYIETGEIGGIYLTFRHGYLSLMNPLKYCPFDEALIKDE